MGRGTFTRLKGEGKEQGERMKGLEGRVQVTIMAGIGKLCQDEGKGKEPASASRSSKRQTPRLTFEKARYGEKYFLENILRSILFF